MTSSSIRWTTAMPSSLAPDMWGQHDTSGTVFRVLLCVLRPRHPQPGIALFQ